MLATILNQNRSRERDSSLDVPCLLNLSRSFARIKDRRERSRVLNRFLSHNWLADESTSWCHRNRLLSPIFPWVDNVSRRK